MGTFFRIENRCFQFIHKSLKKLFLSDLIVQPYVRIFFCQKCHFKQYWSTWSTFQDLSFSLQESPKNFRFEKFKDYINLIDENISDLMKSSVLIKTKVVRNGILNNLYFHKKTSYYAIFSLREPPKFTKLTNLMIFKSDTVFSNNMVHSFSRNKNC